MAKETPLFKELRIKKMPAEIYKLVLQERAKIEQKEVKNVNIEEAIFSLIKKGSK